MTILGAIAMVVIAATIGAVVGFSAGPSEPGSQGTRPTVSTVQVTSGDLVAETRVPGTIVSAQTVEVVAGRGGVVTELPAPGASVTAGGILARIDTQPIVLLAGGLPAWRDFTAEMTDGDDVVQLEQNLVAMGFFTEQPDASFDWETTVAIRDWQRALGLDRTGELLRSAVMFWSGSPQVDSVVARLGQEVGPGTVLLRMTSPEKVVDVNVPSSDRGLAVVGQSVTITLPDGSTTDGIIQSVGAPMSRSEADGTGTKIVIPVRVGVADQDSIAALALANVSVSFASTLRDDVLTVPVDALVPLDDSHYAVEVPPSDESGERTLIPVTVGAITAGNIEIAGDGVVEGLVVVVPAR